jgi:hypothetical protein
MAATILDSKTTLGETGTCREIIDLLEAGGIR